MYSQEELLDYSAFIWSERHTFFKTLALGIYSFVLLVSIEVPIFMRQRSIVGDTFSTTRRNSTCYYVSAWTRRKVGLRDDLATNALISWLYLSGADYCDKVLCITLDKVLLEFI